MNTCFLSCNKERSDGEEERRVEEEEIVKKEGLQGEQRRGMRKRKRWAWLWCNNEKVQPFAHVGVSYLRAFIYLSSHLTRLCVCGII